MTKPRRYYYAGGSDHGNGSSFGFSNDWTVYVFDNKHSRDAFVENSNNLSMVPLKRCDVTLHAANFSITQNRTIEPLPFAGEFWGVVEPPSTLEDVAGLVGTVEVCDDMTPNIISRFYN